MQSLDPRAQAHLERFRQQDVVAHAHGEAGLARLRRAIAAGEPARLVAAIEADERRIARYRRRQLGAVLGVGLAAAVLLYLSATRPDGGISHGGAASASQASQQGEARDRAVHPAMRRQEAAPTDTAAPAMTDSPDASASGPGLTRGPAGGAVPVPSPAPRHAQPGPRPAASTLNIELGLLQRAREALGAGDAGAALAALVEHQERFPGGRLAEERAVLRIDALCSQGARDQARAEIERFLVENRDSAHIERVRRACNAP